MILMFLRASLERVVDQGTRDGAYIGDELLDGLSLPAGCGMPPVMCSSAHTRRSVQPFHRNGEIDGEVRRPCGYLDAISLLGARRVWTD